MQAVATSGVEVAGQPSASPDAASNTLPIKATPFISAARHNERRRVGQGGKNNIAMPNLKDMVSANNRYMTDINDKETINLSQSKNYLKPLILNLTRKNRFIRLRQL
jgi:hypothetical protein